MGGRGSTNGLAAAKSRSASRKALISKVGNMSKSSIGKLGRSVLEGLARAIYVEIGIAQGLSESEADYRARSLMSGNTTSQLASYVYKKSRRR